MSSRPQVVCGRTTAATDRGALSPRASSGTSFVCPVRTQPDRMRIPFPRDGNDPESIAEARVRNTKEPQSVVGADALFNELCQIARGFPEADDLESAAGIHCSGLELRFAS